MNSARDIISYAEEHNIQLSARNGQLILNASKEVLTDDFLQKAKTYKPELLKALEDRRTHVQKLISSACRGLEITPQQLTALCTEEDLEDIRTGATSVETLRAYAASFADGIRTRRIAFHPKSQELIRHN